MGFPIRKSADQRSFAAPRGLSQRSTSFIASQRQGIHQTPLRHLIALIINARPRNQLAATGNQILRSDHWLLVTDHWSSALTERPACFEIDPSARAVKQRVGCGSPATCAAATFSDRSPLHDVRQRARQTPAAEAEGMRRAQRCFFSDEPRSCWWSQTGSNRRPPACKAGALPTELWPRAAISDQYSVTRQSRLITGHWLLITGMVGLGRFELPTSRLSSARSNQLSYKPGPEDRERMTEDGTIVDLSSVI